MDLDIDLVVYMRILGIIFALVALVGGAVVAVTFHKHNLQREEAKEKSQSLGTWDVESPNSYSHR